MKGKKLVSLALVFSALMFCPLLEAKERQGAHLKIKQSLPFLSLRHSVPLPLSATRSAPQKWSPEPLNVTDGRETTSEP